MRFFTLVHESSLIPKVQVCYNIDSNADKYVSLDAGIGNISYNYDPATAGHIMSICTPTPVVQKCANIDNSNYAYLSTNVNIGPLSYSYVQDQCTRVQEHIIDNNDGIPSLSQI